MPRIVQYASDCTPPLSQALGKFRHSFRRVMRIADYQVVMGRMGWRCAIKKEMDIGRHVFHLAGASNATSR